jgi:hypothetical protein
MNLVLAVLIVVGVTAVAIGSMLLVRRRAPEGSYFEDGDRAAGVFGVLATGLAVLLGFVVFLAFESLDTSRSGAKAEAQIVAEQFETAQLMPVAVRGRFSGELVCYARSVVHQEWPRMESGSLGDSYNPWGVTMFATQTLPIMVACTILRSALSAKKSMNTKMIPALRNSTILENDPAALGV